MVGASCCPFCGAVAEVYSGGYYVKHWDWCYFCVIGSDFMHIDGMSVHLWNKRV